MGKTVLLKFPFIFDILRSCNGINDDVSTMCVPQGRSFVSSVFQIKNEARDGSVCWRKKGSVEKSSRHSRYAVSGLLCPNFCVHLSAHPFANPPARTSITTIYRHPLSLAFIPKALSYIFSLSLCPNLSSLSVSISISSLSLAISLLHGNTSVFTDYLLSRIAIVMSFSSFPLLASSFSFFVCFFFFFFTEQILSKDVSKDLLRFLYISFLF